MAARSASKSRSLHIGASYERGRVMRENKAQWLHHFQAITPLGLPTIDKCARRAHSEPSSVD